MLAQRFARLNSEQPVRYALSPEHTQAFHNLVHGLIHTMTKGGDYHQRLIEGQTPEKILENLQHAAGLTYGWAEPQNVGAILQHMQGLFGTPDQYIGMGERTPRLHPMIAAFLNHGDIPGQANLSTKEHIQRTGIPPALLSQMLARHHIGSLVDLEGNSQPDRYVAYNIPRRIRSLEANAPNGGRYISGGALLANEHLMRALGQGDLSSLSHAMNDMQQVAPPYREHHAFLQSALAHNIGMRHHLAQQSMGGSESRDSLPEDYYTLSRLDLPRRL